MEIKRIEKEIIQCRAHLAFLEERLEELQRNCDHHFKRNAEYEVCIHCNKVCVLYY